MNYAGIVFNQLLSLIIYALVGVVCVKTKILDEKGLGYISAFIVKVSMPIMILQKIASMESFQFVMSRLPVVLLGGVMFAFNYVLSFVLKKAFKLTGDKGDVYRATTIFGNTAFMGIPVLTALFPENGMLYISLFTLIDQIFLWTVGVSLTTPAAKKVSDKKGFDPVVFKRILTPGFVLMVLAFAMLILGIKFPPFVDKAFLSIGNTVSPMALIYLGGVFCYADIKGSFKHLEYYAAVLFRMVVFPITFYLFMRMINIESETRIALALIGAMPAMTSVSIMAKVNGSEGEYSACQIFLTTLFSVLTLPLVAYIITSLIK